MNKSAESVAMLVAYVASQFSDRTLVREIARKRECLEARFCEGARAVASLIGIAIDE
jgi:hypothetical protein